jgi:hypothetical protein
MMEECLGAKSAITFASPQQSSLSELVFTTQYIAHFPTKVLSLATS